MQHFEQRSSFCCRVLTFRLFDFTVVDSLSAESCQSHFVAGSEGFRSHRGRVGQVRRRVHGRRRSQCTAAHNAEPARARSAFAWPLLSCTPVSLALLLVVCHFLVSSLSPFTAKMRVGLFSHTNPRCCMTGLEWTDGTAFLSGVELGSS